MDDASEGYQHGRGERGVPLAIGCAVIFLVILLVALLVVLPNLVIVEPPMEPEP